jgi:hypothetical protein
LLTISIKENVIYDVKVNFMSYLRDRGVMLKKRESFSFDYLCNKIEQTLNINSVFNILEEKNLHNLLCENKFPKKNYVKYYVKR